jgi:hypothetical protein
LFCSLYTFVSTRFCADSYYGKIQDHDEAYYKSFNMIITGLDSVEARRWINATLVGMVDEDDPESLKPLIDGGTEGAFCGLRGGPSVTMTMTNWSRHLIRVQGSSEGYLADHVGMLWMFG